MRFFSTWWRDIRETLSARHDPGHIRVLADIYWRTLIAAAFAVLILVFLYSIWDLTGILHDLGATADTSALPAPALDRSELNATVNAFDDRKTKFEELKTSPPASIKEPRI